MGVVNQLSFMFIFLGGLNVGGGVGWRRKRFLNTRSSVEISYKLFYIFFSVSYEKRLRWRENIWVSNSSIQSSRVNIPPTPSHLLLCLLLIMREFFNKPNLNYRKLGSWESLIVWWLLLYTATATCDPMGTYTISIAFRSSFITAYVAIFLNKKKPMLFTINFLVYYADMMSTSLYCLRFVVSILLIRLIKEIICIIDCVQWIFLSVLVCMCVKMVCEWQTEKDSDFRNVDINLFQSPCSPWHPCKYCIFRKVANCFCFSSGSRASGLAVLVSFGDVNLLCQSTRAITPSAKCLVGKVFAIP